MNLSHVLAAMATAGALCLGSSAARAEALWIVDRSGCQHVNPLPQADERLEWNGACKGGRGHGPGELKWIVRGETVQVMKVSLVDGKAQGLGSATYPKEGHRYEGEFRDGVMQGYGTLHMSTGTRYDGPIERGQPHGQGTLRWRNGNRYEGVFVNGVRTGRGRLLFANGNRYEGDFVAGVPEGQGLAQKNDGSRYEGLFSKGLPMGLGISVLPDGTRYEGEFAAGKPTGSGRYWNAAGDVLAPPIDATLLQRLSLVPRPERPAPAAPLDAALVCPKMVPPAVPPNLNWTGQATFFIQAVSRNGRMDAPTVIQRKIDGVEDEAVMAAMLRSITDAVQAYECTLPEGACIQQEFVFQID